jgi:hypothetical protein
LTQATISAFDKRTRHEDWHLFALKKALGLASVEYLYEIGEEGSE